MVTEETFLPTTFVTDWTPIGYCKMFDFLFWLIFLVSFAASLTTMRSPNFLIGELKSR